MEPACRSFTRNRMRYHPDTWDRGCFKTFQLGCWDDSGMVLSWHMRWYLVPISCKMSYWNLNPWLEVVSFFFLLKIWPNEETLYVLFLSIVRSLKLWLLCLFLWRGISFHFDKYVHQKIWRTHRSLLSYNHTRFFTN